MGNNSKTEQPIVMANGLLFNQFEREIIRKYNGVWGWKTPNYAPSIIIRYNLLKIQREFIRTLRVRQIVEWISNH